MTTFPSSTPGSQYPTEMWLLVVAHPDDESMFFIPTLRNLILSSPTPSCDENRDESCHNTSTLGKVGVLCLSNGDYRAASDGPIREKEMRVACSLIGGKNHNNLDVDRKCNSTFNTRSENYYEDGRITATVLNDKRMKDGPDVGWNSEDVSEAVLEHIRGQVVSQSSSANNRDAGSSSVWGYISREELNNQQRRQLQRTNPPLPSSSSSSSSSSSHRVQTINLNLITFDEGGVSGHANHVDVYRGIRYLLREKCHVTSKKGVGGKDIHVTTVLRLGRKSTTTTAAAADSKGGGVVDLDEVVEINVSVHTLNTISNPLYKYFMWAFVNLLPFLVRLLLRIVLHVFFFFLGALPWMEQDTTTPSPSMRQFSGVNMIHRTSTVTTMQFRIMDPILVWRAMAAHQSQFVWYRRLSVMFSRYTYINDLQTMTVDHEMLSSMDEDSDDGMIASVLPPVVAVQEESSSPKFTLTVSQMNILRDSVLPPGLTHRPWKRIYSLLRDGDSFVAFQKSLTDWCKCQGQQSSLLVVKTAEGHIIGGYADVPLVNLTSSLSTVGGAGRSCLFKFSKTAIEDYGQAPHSMVEVYGKHCTTTSKKIVFDAYRRIIAFGGGENSDCLSDDEGFGLSLEDGFARGTTARCAAFDNEPLVSDRGGVFDVVDVEVWGFAFGHL